MTSTPNRSTTMLPPRTTTHRSPSGPARAESPHHAHTTTFGYKMQHMFDKERYAVFHATVTIMELASLPGGIGEYRVEYKFRGHTPSGREMKPSPGLGLGQPSPKPSLSNLRLENRSTNPSSSSLPLRAQTPSMSSTMSGSSSSTGTFPLAPRPNHQAIRPSGLGKNPKALSLPPQSLASIPQRVQSDGSARSDESTLTPPRSKKRSDPTPLRIDATSAETHAVDSSPTKMTAEEEDVFETTTGLARPRLDSDGSGSRSTGSRASDGSLKSANSLSLPSGSGSASMHMPVPSPATSRLSVPSSSQAGPSSHRPRPLSRTVSNASATSQMMGPGTSSTSLQMRRIRSATGPALTLTKAVNNRRGSTPARRVIKKEHVVPFSFEVQHTMRIALGKDDDDTGSSTPGRKPRAPMLGAGPMSESGLSLLIEQSVPSHRTPTTATFNGGGEGSSKQNDAVFVPFGYVNIDLAPFAAHPRMSRRYLLKASKSNANIKVCVELKWVGGEDRWSVPEMRDGYLVQGIQDIVGPEEHEAFASTPRDGSLEPSPTNSASASSVNMSLSNRSGVSSIPGGLGDDAGFLAIRPSAQRYKSFEAHLAGSIDSPHTTLDAPRSGKTTPRSSSPGRKPPTPSLQPHTRRYATPAHHFHHHANFDRLDAPVESIIEDIFNPVPAAVRTPFTYVPAREPPAPSPVPQPAEESPPALEVGTPGVQTPGLGEKRPRFPIFRGRRHASGVSGVQPTVQVV